MARKTYYLVLGVSVDESQAGIRARYHDLARTHHPDLAGDESTPGFQEINEAYYLLGDPGRRASHDEDIGVMPNGGQRVAARVASMSVSG